MSPDNPAQSPGRPRSTPQPSAGALNSLLLGAGLATVVLLPFLLAGRTGNPLWIAAPVFITLIYVAVRETPRCLAYYRSLWPWDWLPALGLALAAMVVTMGIAIPLSLAPAGSPLNWSLGTFFHVGGDAGMNGFAIPLTHPLLALVYVPVALLALPLLAWWEEDIFRRGTRGMRSALIRSTLFGLVHLTAGVSLGACFALGCAGYVFTLGYWRALRDPRAAERRAALPAWVCARLLPRAGGRRAAEDYAVFRATQAHLLYNAVVIVAVVITLLLQGAHS
jgi:hypothetical protein